MKLFFILFLLFLVFGCENKNNYPKKKFPASQTKETRGNLSNIAPDFTLPLIDGGNLTLSEFKGKIILLDIWVSYCPMCRMVLGKTGQFLCITGRTGKI